MSVITEEELRIGEKVRNGDTFKDNTDPKYVGPGTWSVIHKRAYKATTKKLQKEFIEFMKETCYEFPCTVCRGHCTEYINNHPLEEYLNNSVEIGGKKEKLGMFVWSWKFHNAVNMRLGKPIMDWDTAHSLYSNDSDEMVCSESCKEADGTSKAPENSHKAHIPKLPEFVFSK
jgi:hypothetical protein